MDATPLLYFKIDSSQNYSLKNDEMRRNPLIYILRSDYPSIVQKSNCHSPKKQCQYLAHSSKNYCKQARNEVKWPTGQQQVWRPHVRTWRLLKADVLYCIEEGSCNIVGTFRCPGSWVSVVPRYAPDFKRRLDCSYCLRNVTHGLNESRVFVYNAL